VLDNAAGELQVLPLLPAAAGCAVLITSRRRLAGLPAAHQVDLGVFTAEQSLDLLQRMIGPDRVSGERDDCVRVAARCGYLPLAIRVAGARLAARPHWPVARLADQLADTRARLDVLRTGDLEVRSSLALGISALAEPQRRLLCLLGAVDAPAVPGWLAAALLDLAPAEGEELAESLADARFADVDAPGRYRLHDLVRAFALEQIADLVGAQEAATALTRAVSAWLALAEAAHDRLPGGFRQLVRDGTDRWNRWEPTALATLLADPARWCEQERAGLAGAVALAAELAVTGPHRATRQRAAGLAWSLATTLARFFELREHLDDWHSTHEAALRACLATGDLRGEAYLRRSLGELHLNLDRLDESFGQLGQALALMEQIGDQRGEAAVLRAIGTVHRLRGRYEEAMAALARTEQLCLQLDDLVGHGQVLHNIGAVHRLAGRGSLAEQSYRRALGIFELAGDRFGEAFTLCSLGMVCRSSGERSSEVEEYLLRSVQLCTELEYWRGAGIALGHLGDLHLHLGQTDRAVGELRQALAYCREVGDSYNECTELRRLGEAHLANGQTETARAVLAQALAAATDSGRADEQASITATLERCESEMRGQAPATD
jgi:tetratricopeptide (TPR) repeat protein